ncbi:MAG: AAA family ATPase, partial [Ardenticatenaceae bacterium]
MELYNIKEGYNLWQGQIDKERTIMIDSVEIKNFKSILQAKIKFSPLTVLVGTNGAGKSNLTLALAFLSHVSNHGLAAAVNHFGGFRSLLPQIEAFSGQKPKSAPERLSFCVSMSLPPSQADHADSPLTVKYELEFGYADLANLDAPAAEPVRITHEKMSFDQFLPPAGILLADFTAQAHTFRTRVSAIRKYDLPLVSTPIEASQNGGHLEAPAATSAVAPSALASICQPERKASWNRILRTLATVAPHVEFVPPHSRPADPPPTLVPARRLAVPLGVC